MPPPSRRNFVKNPLNGDFWGVFWKELDKFRLIKMAYAMHLKKMVGRLCECVYQLLRFQKNNSLEIWPLWPLALLQFHLSACWKVLTIIDWMSMHDRIPWLLGKMFKRLAKSYSSTHQITKAILMHLHHTLGLLVVYGNGNIVKCAIFNDFNQKTSHCGISTFLI